VIGRQDALGHKVMGGRGQLVHLRGEVVGALPVGRLLDDAVGELHAAGRRLLGVPRAAAAQQLAEGGAELLRHGVVDDRVDGAVQVDAEAAEEQEVGVLVRLVQEGVDHHQCPVRHPQQRKQDDHHGQHLGHLVGGGEMKRFNTVVVVVEVVVMVVVVRGYMKSRMAE